MSTCECVEEQEEQEESEQRNTRYYVTALGGLAPTRLLDIPTLVKCGLSEVELEHEEPPACRFKKYLEIMRYIHVADLRTGTQALVKLDESRMDSFYTRHIAVYVKHDANGAVCADVEYRSRIL